MLLIPVRELQPNDFFSFKGFTQKHNGYTLRSIEMIGADMYFIKYSLNSQWRYYESVKRGSQMVHVAEFGRRYRG